MSDFRTEHDSMGDVRVPADAYYGAQTQRAVENFPISGWGMPPAMVSAMGLVKYACGVANRDLGKLTEDRQKPTGRFTSRRHVAGSHAKSPKESWSTSSRLTCFKPEAAPAAI